MSQASLMLTALAYPKLHDLDLSRQQDVRQIVSWLESRKIRQYKPEQRAGIGNLSGAEWDVHFKQYMQDLECPVTHDTDVLPDMLDWLLHHAVSLEYQDAAPRMTLPETSGLTEAAPEPAEPSFIFPDVSSEEVSSSLLSLVQKLRLQGPDTSLIDQLKACRDLVSQLLPSISDPHAQEVSEEVTQQLSKFDARSFPLGFTTGDEQLDMAATVLRMLYIKDLRLLQSSVDESIVAIQEFTANPRTDSALGRIGR
ncbi:hypothetical protein WJX84_005579 [Apatococcus fuscideae]|uniref:Carnitine deficiency-associated protein n=1 Tax=Apatococcus fuscideae TaxID=2026836 RepID=A0AAW1TJS9_9CHLO